VALAWFVLCAVLVLIELRHLAFYALFAAVGSFGAAMVALVAPSAIPLQAAVAVVLAGAGVVAVRPAMSAAFPRHHSGHVARGVHGGLVGQEALTLDEVGRPQSLGHVRLTGERWLAVSGSGAPIAANTVVLVTAIQGTTLVVWPTDDEGAPPGDSEGDEK
jgi:membrane protein implicated in regulation of membrane protease activity